MDPVSILTNVFSEFIEDQKYSGNLDKKNMGPIIEQFHELMGAKMTNNSAFFKQVSTLNASQFNSFLSELSTRVDGNVPKPENVKQIDSPEISERKRERDQRDKQNKRERDKQNKRERAKNDENNDIDENVQN